MGAITAPEIGAVLGPTNTGKTHRAIETMLAHRTGMIGFPLRLLASENYQRLGEKIGFDKVALVTGEQKIVPPGARYFLCTTESMPLHLPLEFVAVDEVQLAADPERGHIVTERILNARGTKTTMFMGAKSMGPILRRLEPDIVIDDTLKRRSNLTYERKPADIAWLPPRSIVVAFSIAEVHRLAALISATGKGVAVISGALSPRARLAQMELFNSGERPVLVATDAVGMGLNTAADHVYFAETWKFDGTTRRPLKAEEVAQIAGRAGRDHLDGSFGLLAINGKPPKLDEEIVARVLAHDFAPVRQVMWRNSDLDFSSIDALLESLDVPPPARDYFCQLPRKGEDHRTLAQLADRREIREITTTPKQVQLLWEAAQIPDFRKNMGQHHAAELAHIYRYLCNGQKLSRNWLAANLPPVDAAFAPMGVLVGHYDWTRFLRVLAHKSWIDEPVTWQEYTQAAEDRLSDAMHSSLCDEFGGRHNARLAKGSCPNTEIAVIESGAVMADGVEVGRLQGFSFKGSFPNARTADKIYRVLGQSIETRVQALEEDPAYAFNLTLSGQLKWRDETVGRLKQGPSGELLRPDIELFEKDFLSKEQRARIKSRLDVWLSEEMRQHLRPLLLLELACRDDYYKGVPAGLLYSLRQGLGTVALNDVRLGPETRSLLGETRPVEGSNRQLQIQTGERFLYVKGISSPAAIDMRAALWNAAHGTEYRPLGANTVSQPINPNTADRNFYRAIGFPILGAYAIRVDRLEAALEGAPGGKVQFKNEAAAALEIPAMALRAMQEALNPEPNRAIPDSPFAGLASLLSDPAVFSPVRAGL